MSATPRTPWPKQIEDLSRLIAKPNTPLLSDPGTGKTVVAALYTRYCVDHLGYKCVWTMPSGLLDKNHADIIEDGGFKKEEVIVVRGSPARRLKLMNSPVAKVFLMTGDGFSAEWRLLLNAQPTCRVSVHDEFHRYYSNHNSKRTQEWYQACDYMFSVVPMTGSILKGRLNSAYPMFHAKFPLYYGTHESFLATHALYDLDGRIIGWRNHERLKELLSVVGIRRSFKEMHGEESKVIQVHPVALEGDHAKLYLKWKAMNVMERGDEELLITDGNAALEALRARQILARPVELGVMPLGFVPQKDIDLEELVIEAIENKEATVIFSVFPDEQARIMEIVKRNGGTIGLINGTVSDTQRTKVSNDYIEGRTQFVCATPDTAGFGYNWHHTVTMIFTTVTYQDDSFLQAYRRGIRGPRETPLRIILMAYRHSIEEKILQKVDQKSRDANMVDPTKEAFELSGYKARKKTKEDDVKVVAPVAGVPLSMNSFWS